MTCSFWSSVIFGTLLCGLAETFFLGLTSAPGNVLTFFKVERRSGELECAVCFLEDYDYASASLRRFSYFFFSARWRASSLIYVIDLNVDLDSSLFWSEACALALPSSFLRVDGILFAKCRELMVWVWPEQSL